MALSERERELLLAVAEAVVADRKRRPQFHFGLHPEYGGQAAIKPWYVWCVAMQARGDTLEAALSEAAERLGVLPEPKRPFIEEEGW